MGNQKVSGKYQREGAHGNDSIHLFVNSWANSQAHIIGPDPIQETSQVGDTSLPVYLMAVGWHIHWIGPNGSAKTLTTEPT